MRLGLSSRAHMIALLVVFSALIVVWDLGGCIARFNTKSGVPGDETDRAYECSTYYGCGSEATCWYGYCVSANTTGAPLVDVQLLPPVQSGYLRPVQSVANDLSALWSPVLDLTVASPVKLSGRIQPPGDGPASFSSVEVAAERPGAIPGTKVRFSVVAQRPASGDWVYSLPILPGTYLFAVTPNEPSVPPVLVADVQVSTSSSRDFYFSPMADLVDVPGRIVLSDATGTPVAGMLVTANDSTAHIRSTTATSTADGTFSLRLPRGASAASLSVRPGGDSTAAYPAVDVGPLDLSGSGDGGVLALAIGELGVGARAALRVVSPDGGAAEAVRIRVSGTVGNGSVTVTGATNDAGEWGATLFPATYEVRAVPPATSPWGSLRKVVEVGDGGTLGTWTLPERIPIEVWVVDGLGVSVPSASVTFRRVGEVDPRVASWIAEDISVTTASWGVALLRVDPGRFDISVVPSQSTNAPRATLKNVTVTKSGDLLKLALGQGVRFTGRVTGGTGASPLSSVVVEFFSRARDAGTGLGADGGTTSGAGDAGGGTQTPMLVGATVTADDGTYVVTLPRD